MFLVPAQSEKLRGRQSGSFQSAFYGAVMDGLSEVLGSAGAQAASFHIGLRSGTSAAAVHEGLVRVFGTGARLLELSILRELYSASGARFEPEESRTFAGYVAGAKEIQPVGRPDRREAHADSPSSEDARPCGDWCQTRLSENASTPSGVGMSSLRNLLSVQNQH